MQSENKTDEVTSALAQLRFLKGSVLLLLAWPIACIAVGALVWTLTLSRLGSERQSIEAQARQDARALSHAYAEQLARTVGQLDQITLTLAYYWKQSGGTLRLEPQAGQGLYPDTPNFSIGIHDRTGKAVTSLLKRSGTVDISDRAYFKAHKSGRTTGLLVEKVARGRITGTSVVVLSRALTDKAGEFDGVVYVAVEPEFLASFYDKAAEGENDLLAVLSDTGETIASKLGGNVRHGDTLTRQARVFPGGEGFALVSGDGFADDRARLLSWSRLDKYPFVSVAALDHEGRYAAFAILQRDYMGMVAGATLLLGFAGVMGGVFTGRLIWRKHQSAVITDTYRLATEGAREGFFMVRALYGRDREITDFVIENCNEQGAHMLGMDKDGLIGLRFSQLYAGRLGERVMATFRDAMQKGFHEDEFRLVPGDDAVWVHRRLVRSGDGLAINMHDITQAKSHERALRSLVNTDALTNLPNRYWLTEHLPGALQAARRSGDRLAVIYLDLDDFKDVNNTMGHAAGDDVLRQAGQRMQSVLRPGDHVVRLGGDEFTVVLSRVAAPEEAAQIAGRILDTLAAPFDVAGGCEHLVRASAGISLYPDDGGNAETLLKHADTAMYAAKHAGKGCLAFYTPALTEQIVSRVSNETALRQAVEGKQFILHYQPRVDAASGALVSMEALVRWQHPERGMVPPLDFIPLAEETGLIVEIGELVIDQACAQIAAWQREGLGTVSLSVNVSPRQFAHYDLKAVIASAIARHGIAPSLLEIEITESCMMQDSATVANDIAAIKAMGIRVSVDDFGTGFSSLSQLQRLDLDVLKVDRAFTRELASSKHGKEFFLTIVSMAHVLGMQVVAEGVETHEQLAILQQLGCNEIQGYLISKPVPAAAAAAFLKQRSLFPPSVPTAPVSLLMS